MAVLVGMIPTNPLASMVKADILPIIVFALFVGYGILQVEPNHQKTIIGFFDACAEVCYKVVAVVMSFAPVGVFCLLVPVVAKNGPAVLLPLISVIVTMAVACIIHTTVVYSGLVSILAKMSPMKFFNGASEHMLVAFTTCSSAAALPINMKNTQEKLGFPARWPALSCRWGQPSTWMARPSIWVSVPCSSPMFSASTSP